MLVLVIVRDIQEARRRGCAHGTCRHPAFPGLQFWWPRLGRDLLRGRQFQLIVLAVDLDAELREFVQAHLIRPTAEQPGGPVVVEGHLWR